MAKGRTKSNWRDEQPAGTKLRKRVLKSMYGTWKDSYRNVRGGKS